MKPKKPKAVNYSLIEDSTSEPYVILRDLVRLHHSHLAEASIALAWRYGLKADRDGRLKLGECRKASDLSRELVDYDFVILLNFEAWGSPEWGEAMKRAVIDHELEHCGVCKDEAGEVQRDERDRIVYRVRKHDLEEFRSIVQRHGLYRADLEEFAATLMDRANKPLFKIAGAN